MQAGCGPTGCSTLAMEKAWTLVEIMFKLWFWRECGFWSSTNCCVTFRQISMLLWSFTFSTVTPATPRLFCELPKSSSRWFRILKGMCWFIATNYLQGKCRWPQGWPGTRGASLSHLVLSHLYLSLKWFHDAESWGSCTLGLKVSPFHNKRGKRLLSPSSSFENAKEDL